MFTNHTLYTCEKHVTKARRLHGPPMEGDEVALARAKDTTATKACQLQLMRTEQRCDAAFELFQLRHRGEPTVLVMRKEPYKGHGDHGLEQCPRRLSKAFRSFVRQRVQDNPRERGCNILSDWRASLLKEGQSRNELQARNGGQDFRDYQATLADVHQIAEPLRQSPLDCSVDARSGLARLIEGHNAAYRSRGLVGFDLSVLSYHDEFTGHYVYAFETPHQGDMLERYGHGRPVFMDSTFSIACEEKRKVRNCAD